MEINGSFVIYVIYETILKIFFLRVKINMAFGYI